ncbi:uncharacterized protein LOC115695566 [Cannabis sativa]|uniref:uncharacterized protein LOC115695566 n=1 Tax=Cannabis sativa TaxID=3483 RepID=UPI0029C9BD00|nr:uncharacterized protein LOC115695566 [Cannabis sativa]
MPGNALLASLKDSVAVSYWISSSVFLCSNWVVLLFVYGLFFVFLHRIHFTLILTLLMVILMILPPPLIMMTFITILILIDKLLYSIGMESKSCPSWR